VTSSNEGRWLGTDLLLPEHASAVLQNVRYPARPWQRLAGIALHTEPAHHKPCQSEKSIRIVLSCGEDHTYGLHGLSLVSRELRSVSASQPRASAQPKNSKRHIILLHSLASGVGLLLQCARTAEHNQGMRTQTPGEPQRGNFLQGYMLARASAAPQPPGVQERGSPKTRQG
jgi:hypothetical protein